MDLDVLPRHYTVEPGKSLSGNWPMHEETFALQLRGPNRWFRELRGTLKMPLSLRCRTDAATLVVEVLNHGTETIMIHCRDLLAGATQTSLTVSPGTTTWRVPTAASEQWYDVELKSSDGVSFYRRASGRIETGRHSISWPGYPIGTA